MGEENKHNEKKIEFLYEAISDAQSLIQYTDTKTAIATTVIGAIIVGIYSNLSKVITNFTKFDFWFYSTFIILNIFFVLTIWIVTRIIFPTNDPRENIKISDHKKIYPRFFISDNKYNSKYNWPFFNSTDLRLKGKLQEYINEINESDDNAIIESLTFELLKVSFIRTLKNDRFKILVWFILLSTILFFVNTIIFQYQISNIENIITTTKCH